jgi:hypothetical protein
MPIRLFISYSRLNSGYALDLQDKLNERGCGVWLDTEKLQTGQHWREEIVQAISSCDYFVLLLSAASIRSENVIKELSLAESYGKPILPLMIETVEVPDAMKYQLAGLQFMIVNPSQADHGVEALLAVLPPSTAQPAKTALEASGSWDKQQLLNHLLLAIGPIANLLLAPLPDPLQEQDRLSLDELFRHYHLDPALLVEGLAQSQRPTASGLDPSLAQWFRLQVGPIADVVWDQRLEQELQHAPQQAGARLEQIGVNPKVVQELLQRCQRP